MTIASTNTIERTEVSWFVQTCKELGGEIVLYMGVKMLRMDFTYI